MRNFLIIIMAMLLFVPTMFLTGCDLPTTSDDPSTVIYINQNQAGEDVDQDDRDNNEHEEDNDTETRS